MACLYRLRDRSSGGWKCYFWKLTVKFRFLAFGGHISVWAWVGSSRISRPLWNELITKSSLFKQGINQDSISTLLKNFKQSFQTNLVYKEIVKTWKHHIVFPRYLFKVFWKYYNGSRGKGMIKREEEKLESLIKNSLPPPLLRLFNLLWMFGRVFLNPCD